MRNIKTLKLILFFLALIFTSCSNNDVEPPKPYGAIPSDRQLEWHELEFYGFLHFTVNTFTNKEWGYGDESNDVFNPTDYDPDQIVRTVKEAGMKGLILTCKHHDGFCLWPSKFTEHSVKNSSWKNGEGDVVKDISEACKRYGLKFGVYLSPWDRNSANYGTPAYIEYYRNQLKELLIDYGPVFEIWFDGANGGDGYYGGANEVRKIDRSTYYDWPVTWQIVREFQPDAVIFSDVGPDIRWIGNERGIANDTCWATYTPHGIEGKEPGPGTIKYKEGQGGHRNGKYWIAPECDVSIRPGWFYHKNEDRKVRDPENLMNLYFKSVGRGASFLLNLPPDTRGQIHENDVKSLMEFKKNLDKMYEKDLAQDAKLKVSNIRGNAKSYGPENLTDNNRETYWATDDEVNNPDLILEFKNEVVFNIVSIREFLPLGQRIDGWAIDRWEDGDWVEFASGASIGNRRLWRGEEQTSSKIRFRITSSPVCPAISEFALFHFQE